MGEFIERPGISRARVCKRERVMEGMRVIESSSSFGQSFPLGTTMVTDNNKQKTIVIGAGPVGALAALYAAQRGHEVEVYELRSGTLAFSSVYTLLSCNSIEHPQCLPKRQNLSSSCFFQLESFAT
jgi:hypothetical protein